MGIDWSVSTGDDFATSGPIQRHSNQSTGTSSVRQYSNVSTAAKQIRLQSIVPRIDSPLAHEMSIPRQSVDNPAPDKGTSQLCGDRMKCLHGGRLQTPTSTCVTPLIQCQYRTSLPIHHQSNNSLPILKQSSTSLPISLKSLIDLTISDQSTNNPTIQQSNANLWRIHQSLTNPSIHDPSTNLRQILNPKFLRM